MFLSRVCLGIKAGKREREEKRDKTGIGDVMTLTVTVTYNQQSIPPTPQIPHNTYTPKYRIEELVIPTNHKTWA